ncbi:Uncharacterised protein [Mycobacteroides abscessus subsp. abscessus]|nr:Uncharacterised protein [Mycobacteroides abscessus subsp. abscessus]
MVDPATSRRSVAYTSHVMASAITMNTDNPISGPRNLIADLPPKPARRQQVWCL